MKPDISEQEQRLRDKLLPEIETFKQQRKTLQLATVDTDGQPNARLKCLSCWWRMKLKQNLYSPAND